MYVVCLCPTVSFPLLYVQSVRAFIQTTNVRSCSTERSLFKDLIKSVYVAFRQQEDHSFPNA